jgi:hypothetical protein
MSDIYKIGVSIALANGMSPVLSVIARELLGINSTVKDIEKNFSRWALAAGGAAGFLAGGAIVKGLSKIADAGKELLHQQELMRQAGMSNKEIVDATAKSWETSRQIQVTTASENLKHIRELRYATGNADAAQAILNPVTQANAILNSVKGGGTDQVFELVKSLEQKGLATEEERKAFLSYVDMMTKVVQSTGGRVTPQMFQSTFKYGRTATLGWNEEFITQIMPRLMQSWASTGGAGGSGSGGPGNALMSMFAKLVQGQLSKTSADTLSKLGLLEYNEHIKGSSKSQVRVKGIDMATQNPYEWIQQYLMPALKAQGIGDKEHVTEIIESISKAMGVRTAAAVATEFALQGRAMLGDASPFEKDRKLTLGALGQGGFDSLKQNDPDYIDKAYEAQEKAMLEAIGSAIAPMKMEILKGITDMFTAIAQFAKSNPEAIKNIAIGLGVLGVALMSAGVVAIIAAIGVGGWIAAGIVVLAGAIAMLAKPAYEAAVAGIHKIGEAIEWIVAKIASIKVPSLDFGKPGDFTPAPGHGSSHAAPGKRSEYVPPGLSHGGGTQLASVYMDGRKVGNAVLGHINDRSGRPTEGSPYHDATWSSAPYDFASSTG